MYRKWVPVACIVVLGCAGPQTDSRFHSSVPVNSKVAARPDAPDLKRLKNGHYRVRKPWKVTLEGRVYHIPAGYTSNGITGPAALKGQLGDGVEFRETWAAVFHDWLFTQKGVERVEADQTFHRLLLAYGVSSTKAGFMFTTVSAYTLTRSKR